MKLMTSRAALALPLAALVAAAFPGPASVAASGDLDPGFGTAGVAVIDERSHEVAYDTVVQPDGKIVVVGEAVVEATRDALVVRLNADGTRDAGFGYRTLPGPPGASTESASAVALQPDGKIVMAGRTSRNMDAAVWRVLPSGAPDLSFGGGDGLVTIDSGDYESLADVAIAPDGAIVVAGRTTANGGEAVVYRLTSAGEKDNSFDWDGALGIGESNSSASSVAVQPDGKILVAGDIAPATGMVVRRLMVNGAPDTGFGNAGEAKSIADSDARDLVVQPDGQIVVAGTAKLAADDDALLVRYTASGRLDTSFGSPTGAQFDAGDNEDLMSVALMPDGGVVASGTSSAGEEAIVVRATSTGQPQPGFGTGGVVTLPGTIVEGEGVAVAPDRRIVVVGEDEKYFSSAVVYRLLGDYQPRPPAVEKCQGKTATIVGTPGKDRITGTTRADVIAALGGNDVVKGLGGNDLVCAGDGDDTVKGGPGKDDLRGERGADRLVGGTGKDKLVGGPQQDTVTQ